VIYSDGSCLACAVPELLDPYAEDSWDPNVGPGFLPDGRLAVSVDGRLGAMNTDGMGFDPFSVSGSPRQTAWSPTGQLAAVQSVNGKPEVFVINPATGSARQLTRDGASSPNWSPDGRRLAVVHGGWIELIGSHGGPVLRLTRGGAPAWAPDGKQLAFVGAHDRLVVISVRGGRPRPVGHIRALRVDWQSVTGKPPRPCQAPAGSRVLAASPDATVTIDGSRQRTDRPVGAFSVVGCLTSDGHKRDLVSMPPQDGDSSSSIWYTVGVAAVAGDYAALVNKWEGPFHGAGNAVAVFDLRTGTSVSKLGGERAECPYPCYGSGIDQLVLGADGVTAAHTFVLTFTPYVPGQLYSQVEQIVANDSTGTHILDSISITPTYPYPLPDGFTPTLALSQPALSGDTLTWSHAGTPESAQLNRSTNGPAQALERGSGQTAGPVRRHGNPIRPRPLNRA
jgi:hypothetical protein